MGIKKDIIHPQFLACCEFIDDEYWKYIFEELSYGKCPYGSYFQNNNICCKYKGKEFSYNILEENIEKMANEIINLFKTKLYINSQTDRMNKLEKMYKTTSTIDSQDWSNIKKKTIKEHLIENYVIQISKEYAISINETKLLYAFIIRNIMFKNIIDTDIEYSDNKIIDINSIYIDKTDKKFYLVNENAVNDKKGDKKTPNVNNTNLMSINWMKYVEKFNED